VTGNTLFIIKGGGSGFGRVYCSEGSQRVAAPSPDKDRLVVIENVEK